jgi:hypothetical protein
MPEFQSTYNGRGTAVTLPNSDRLDRAQENMSNLILGADKMRLDAFKKNEERFLKTTDIDLETYISQSNADTQTKMIDEYNKTAQKMLKDKGGRFENFTTQDWQELNLGKKILQAKQQKMSTDLERFKLMDKTVQSRPDQWDTDEWNTLKADYLKTGNLPDVELPVRAKPLEVFLNEKKLEGTQTLDYGQPFMYNGQKVKQGTYYSGTEQEARDYVKGMVLSNPAYQKDVFQKFSKLPEAEKIKYLDVNDGTVDRNEAAMASQSGTTDNPILKWAQDTYWQKARATKEGAMTSASPAQSTQGNKYFIGGKWQIVSEGQKKEGTVDLSGVKYDSPLEFNGSYKVNYIPTARAKELTGTSSIKITDATNVEGYLKLYDPTKDVFVFAASGADPNIPNGTMIEVPATDLRNSDIKDFPVMVNGKKLTIEQLRANRGTSSQSKVSTSGVKWK